MRRLTVVWELQDNGPMGPDALKRELFEDTLWREFLTSLKIEKIVDS